MIKSKLDKLIHYSSVIIFITVILMLGSGSGIKAGINAKRQIYTNERRSLTQNPYQNSGISQELPSWVKQLGVENPTGLTFVPSASASTSKDVPAEGFNSVTLVYTGSYEQSAAEAARIAARAKLPDAIDFRAKGSPHPNSDASSNRKLRFANYSLETKTKPYLVSIEVEPSGKLTLMVTDNKQLNEKLLAYEPMILRQKNAENRKKQ